jgi:uncharacterized protein YndB with AHSA1/START domain
MTTQTTTSRPVNVTGADYESSVSIAASPEAVFAALTSTQKVTEWWMPATGSAQLEGELTFPWDTGTLVLRVVRADRPSAVRWEAVSCAWEEWVGSTIEFDITPTGSETSRLHFRHAGLTPQLECFDQCTGPQGWGRFVPSLAAYVESGRGMPLG